jgi:mono/diheme cytochrome c family protein
MLLLARFSRGLGAALGGWLIAQACPAATEDALPPLAQEILGEADSATAGRRLFSRNCTYCHGARGLGGRAKALQCRDDLEGASVFESITYGRQSGAFIMPPWETELEAAERWQLVAYILTLRDLPNCK